MPLASRRRQRGIAPGGDVKDLEFRSDAHAFRVGSARERTLLLGRQRRLQQQNPWTISAMSASSAVELAFGVAAGHAEQLGQT